MSISGIYPQFPVDWYTADWSYSQNWPTFDFFNTPRFTGILYSKHEFSQKTRNSNSRNSVFTLNASTSKFCIINLKIMWISGIYAQFPVDWYTADWSYSQNWLTFDFFITPRLTRICYSKHAFLPKTRNFTKNAHFPTSICRWFIPNFRLNTKVALLLTSGL